MTEEITNYDRVVPVPGTSTISYEPGTCTGTDLISKSYVYCTYRTVQERPSVTATYCTDFQYDKKYVHQYSTVGATVCNSSDT